jgi:hypothetical protein
MADPSRQVARALACITSKIIGCVFSQGIAPNAWEAFEGVHIGYL